MLNSKLQNAESPSRLTFIHNPSSNLHEPHRRVSPIFSHLIAHGLLSKISLKEFELLLVPEQDQTYDSPSGQVILSENSKVYQLLQDVGLAMDGLSDSEAYKRYCHRSRLIARELGISPGEQVLVVNGRVSHTLNYQRKCLSCLHRWLGQLSLVHSKHRISRL